VYPEQRKSKEKYNYTPSMKLLISLSVLLSLVSSIVHADNDLHPRPMNQLLQEVQEADAENEEAARSSNSVRGMEDVSKIDFAPKIVNGVVVNPPFKYPYMVNAGGCGASLVAPNCLLTAAHCEGIKQVQIGRHDLTDLTENFETFDVVVEFPHPNYNEAKPPKYDYDYMMVKLNGTSTRTPVQLDTGADPSFLEAGNNVIVMGWGHTSYGGPSSNVLLEVEIDVISTAKCQESYFATITDRMFCAARANKNMCQGDSGGPIIDKATGKQIGVSSFTPNGTCADSRYPHGYAKVQDQIVWIQKFIKDHCIAPTSPSSSPSSSPTPAPPTPSPAPTPVVPPTNDPTATPTLTVAPTCPPTKAECGGGKC
jgi:trypsin